MDIVVENKRLVFKLPFSYKDRVKTLGATWDTPIKRHWSMPLSALSDELINFIKSEKLKIPLELENKIETFQRKHLQRKSELQDLRNHALIEFENLVKIPTKSGKLLKQYQQEAVKQFINSDFKQINALFVGAGKSVVATFAAKIISNITNCKVLCIVPPSLKDNWQVELEDMQLTAETYSYAKMPNIDDIQGKFFLIFDESHMYQNATAKRTKKMLELASEDRCVGLIHLSGTPMRNGQPKNLYPLLKSTEHEIARNRSKYEIRYCDGHVSGLGFWDNSGATNLEELHTKIANLVFRRDRKDCLDLPEFSRIFQEIELEPQELKIYKENLKLAKEEYERRLEEGEIKSGGEHLVLLGQARKYSSIAKVPATLEITNEFLNANNQVIIFTWYKEVAEKLAKSLKCRTITGDTPQKDRQPFVDEFQRGDKKVIVCTFGAGGQGLNMQAADYLVLVDRDHVPAYYEQAEGRAWRQGREKPVTSVWLNLVHNQVDSVIDAVILGKQQTIDLVIKGKKKKLRPDQHINQIAQKLLAHLYDIEE